jgi:hypothetical protein
MVPLKSSDIQTTDQHGSEHKHPTAEPIFVIAANNDATSSAAE